MKKAITCISVSLALLFFPKQAAADIVFPARLEIVELEPGLFQVTFTLPIVNGRYPKARPALPGGCEEVAEHIVTGAGGAYTETWQVRCKTTALFGESIRIEGLLGTQVDVIFTMELLNGRSYQAVLKPAKPVYVIPLPPTVFELAGQALLEGARLAVSRPELYLLLAMLLFSGLRGRELLPALGAFFITFATGRWLAGEQWLLVPPYITPIAATILILPIAYGMYTQREGATRPLAPYWPIALLLGLLYGGYSMAGELPGGSGLSASERGIAAAGFLLGLLASLLLLHRLLWELRQGLLLSGDAQRVSKRAGYIGGILATAALFYLLSAFVFYPAVLPEQPPGFLLTALILGLWLATSPDTWKHGKGALLIPVLAGGLAAGLAGAQLPLSSAILFGALFTLGGALALRYTLPAAAWPLAAVTVAYSAAQLGFYYRENLSFPVANALGMGAVAALIVLLSYQLT